MKASFWRNKRVLVTGHEGFLGSHVTRALLKRNAEVIGVDIVSSRPNSVLNGLRGRVSSVKGNIVNLKLVQKLINRYRPHALFHLAAEPIVGRALKNPTRAFRTNIQGTWNMLEGCRGKGFVKSLVVASSDKAYGSHKNLPYREDYELRGSYPYDVSKSCTDLLSYSYFKTYGLPVCVTRCGNIYGPGDFHFSRIVPDAIRSATKGRPVIIRSDGTFVRDYIYVDDIVEGYIRLAERMEALNLYGESFNFSNDRPVSVLELVEKICKLTGKDASYKILNEARCEIKNQYLSSKKARRILGWRPRFMLDEGLRHTLRWYRREVFR